MKRIAVALWTGLSALTASPPANAQIATALAPWLCPVSQIGAACAAGSGVGTCVPARCEQTVPAVDDAGNYVLDDAGRDAGVVVIASQRCATCAAFNSSPDTLWGYCTSVCGACAQGTGFCFDAGTLGTGVGTQSNPDEFLLTYIDTYCRPFDAGENYCSPSPPIVDRTSDADSMADADLLPEADSVHQPAPSPADATASVPIPAETSGDGSTPGGSSLDDGSVGGRETIVGHGPFGCDIAPGRRPTGVFAMLGAGLALIGVPRRGAIRRLSRCFSNARGTRKT